MKRKKTLTLLMVIVLTACSSAPSETEIKSAILADTDVEKCKFVSVENINKVNGVEGQNGKSYQIAYKYTLALKPMPNANEILDSIANTKAQHEKAESELIQLRYAKNNEDVHSKEYKELIQKLRDTEISTKESAFNTQKKAEMEIVKFYATGCAKGTRHVQRDLNIMKIRGHEWIKQGVENQIAGNLVFIKTDNGWMSN